MNAPIQQEPDIQDDKYCHQTTPHSKDKESFDDEWRATIHLTDPANNNTDPSNRSDAAASTILDLTTHCWTVHPKIDAHIAATCSRVPQIEITKHTPCNSNGPADNVVTVSNNNNHPTKRRANIQTVEQDQGVCCERDSSVLTPKCLEFIDDPSVSCSGLKRNRVVFESETTCDDGSALVLLPFSIVNGNNITSIMDEGSPADDTMISPDDTMFYSKMDKGSPAYDAMVSPDDNIINCLKGEGNPVDATMVSTDDTVISKMENDSPTDNVLISPNGSNTKFIVDKGAPIDTAMVSTDDTVDPVVDAIQQKIDEGAGLNIPNTATHIHAFDKCSATSKNTGDSKPKGDEVKPVQGSLNKRSKFGGTFSTSTGIIESMKVVERSTNNATFQTTDTKTPDDFSYVSTLPPNSICSDNTAPSVVINTNDVSVSELVTANRGAGIVVPRRKDYIVKPDAPLSSALLLAVEEVKENVWIYDGSYNGPAIVRSREAKKRDKALPKSIHIQKKKGKRK